jgi:hypothetical protein
MCEYMLASLPLPRDWAETHVGAASKWSRLLTGHLGGNGCFSSEISRMSRNNLTENPQ